MKLLDNQFNEPALSRLGEEACRLLFARDYAGLADKFGYVMAYDQEPAGVIQADFERCLSDHKSPHSGLGYNIESVTVTNYKPNDSGLIAVVFCDVLVDGDMKVFVELVVIKNGEEMYLKLEEVSAPLKNI